MPGHPVLLAPYSDLEWLTLRSLSPSRGALDTVIHGSLISAREGASNAVLMATQRATRETSTGHRGSRPEERPGAMTLSCA